MKTQKHKTDGISDEGDFEIFGESEKTFKCLTSSGDIQLSLNVTSCHVCLDNCLHKEFKFNFARKTTRMVLKSLYHEFGRQCELKFHSELDKKFCMINRD